MVPTSRDAVERAHHKERITQPAVAVVPVAAAVGGPGDAGRHGGHDGAGFSYNDSLSVMAARITASCHSSGMANARLQPRQ